MTDHKPPSKTARRMFNAYLPELLAPVAGHQLLNEQVVDQIRTAAVTIDYRPQKNELVLTFDLDADIPAGPDNIEGELVEDGDR